MSSVSRPPAARIRIFADRPVDRGQPGRLSALLLGADFDDADRGSISRCFERAVAELVPGARITDFLPVLTYVDVRISIARSVGYVDNVSRVALRKAAAARRFSTDLSVPLFSPDTAFGGAGADLPPRSPKVRCQPSGGYRYAAAHGPRGLSAIATSAAGPSFSTTRKRPVGFDHVFDCWQLMASLHEEAAQLVHSSPFRDVQQSFRSYPLLSRKVLDALDGDNKNPRFAGVLGPLPDSNRGPPLYEEGPCVKCSSSCSAESGRVCLVGLVSWAHLSIASSTGRTRPIGVSLRWRISLRAVRRPGGRWRLWERRVVRG